MQGFSRRVALRNRGDRALRKIPAMWLSVSVPGLVELREF